MNQTAAASTGGSLSDRLSRGTVICAEGYLFELERRGYLQAGPFVPEVVLEHPEKVRDLSLEYVRAGSDVVLALTFYANRDKLRVIGKENVLTELNQQAIAIAKDVAAQTGTLAAGNICNTHLFVPGDAAVERAVRAMFEEQVTLAADAGVDFIVAESFAWAREAEIATEVIAESGIPGVVTVSITRQPTTLDGFTPAEGARRSRTQARPSSASTACAVPRRCFPSWQRSAPLSTVPSRRCPSCTGRPRSARASIPSRPTDPTCFRTALRSQPHSTHTRAIATK